jgi:hypothetical protein
MRQTNYQKDIEMKLSAEQLEIIAKASGFEVVTIQQMDNNLMCHPDDNNFDAVMAQAMADRMLWTPEAITPEATQDFEYKHSRRGRIYHER